MYIDGACPVYSCENKNKEKKERMFDEFRKFETTLAGRPLVVETGKMAQLAGGSVLIRYGETEVLCTATMSDKPREGVDFFPMSIDFEEKLYSVGKIPGSFQRREGRASEKGCSCSPRYRPSHPSAFPQGYAQRCRHSRNRYVG